MDRKRAAGSWGILLEKVRNVWYGTRHETKEQK